MNLEEKKKMLNDVLISPKELPSLTDDQIIQSVLQDSFVKEKKEELESLSKTVFKSWNTLPFLINRINEDPDSARILVNKLRSSPLSFSKLAGFKIFGFKSPKRIKAEKNIFKLSLVVQQYGNVVQESRDTIIYHHNLEQARCARKVLIPSDDIQYLLDLPYDMLLNVFKNQDTYQLGKKILLFLNSVDMRLSANELQMLEAHKTDKFAKSMGISDIEASRMIDVVTKATKVLNKINIFRSNTHKISEAQTQELRSEGVSSGIYTNYNPNEAQTQRLRSEGVSSGIYTNYNPNEAQTQWLRSEEEYSAIYDLNEAQTQELRNEEEYSGIYESYDPHEAQTQELRNEEEYSGIYANYDPNEAQTQELRNEEEYSGIYANCDPNRPYARILKTRKEKSDIHDNDDIYDNKDIYDSANIHDNDDIYDNKDIYDSANIHDNDDIYDNKDIYDNPNAQTQELRSEEENFGIYDTAEAQSSKRFLIPAKALAPLTPNEITDKIKINPVVQEHAEKVRDLSELVFGDRELLNSHLAQIIKYPKLGESYSQTLKTSPESIAKFAGSEKWGVGNLRYREAEKNVPELCQAIEEYGNIVEVHHKQIIKNHEKEQKQIHKSVAMPSNEIQRLLNLPSDMRKNILREKNTSQLNKELSVFLNQVNFRLSIHEHMAIKEDDYQTLASSIKVSEVQAREIINFVKEAKTCQQEIKDIIFPQKKRALAVAS
ncbi:BID domain-containing T4SS effector [Bartonella sp. 1-1C]|uniref:BID domain-containing T4SS effector n=1 Tax=Bartonella sp. 1-1C TaxID=515256 RepID=UPI0001F4BEBA|nr:BID domain-containing T4SS effector [Bartonella sp. 1-1C]ATO57036.1 Bartonella effector protein Bep9 [Bartonella sp. 1-1C]CBI81191.1 Bartonella effector protein (Bep); substrate of VirB T4SS [Bartonella sp. 1-1C]